MVDAGERSRLGALILAALTLYASATAAPRADTRARKNAAAPAPWYQLLRDLGEEIAHNHVSMMSASVAFYGLLSLFPGLSALISVYGLVADPATVQNLLASLGGILPAEAVKLLSDQLNSLVQAPPAKLGLGLLVSLALALWSTMSGTTVLMQALTIACGMPEDRGLVRFYLTAAGLTAGLILFGIVSLLLVAVIPALLDWLPFPEAVSFVRWPLLGGLAILALGGFYRLAPSRCGERWRWISPGAVAATLLWIIGSAGFSFYVGSFASYDRTYGSLGAVVVLLMWFYVTAYIILAGAELNTVIERRRAVSR